MELSVIITVYDDVRIKECIESIDDDVEILVVLDDATKEVKEIVNKFDDVRKIEIFERNLGLSREIAIRKSKYNKILLMDSDCVFEGDCIKKAYKALDKYKVVKCKVVFLYRDYIGKIISKVRDYINYDEVKAFAPGLALKKSILEDVGGYYFDGDIHWVEDSELNNRINDAGIEMKFLPEAKIYHSSLTLKQDLRSAFRYGCGKRIGVKKGIMEGIGSFFPKIFDVLKKKGVVPFFYIVLWNVFYCSGFFSQAVFKIYDVDF